MKLYNTLTKALDTVEPTTGKKVRIYSCGPTVYDHIHLGNLSSFIYADALRRSLMLEGYQVKHVMNITDVDDKTIKRSRELYPQLDPHDALKQLTELYTAVFFSDMQRVGNEISLMAFPRATSDQTMAKIQTLINNLEDKGFTYVVEDGVYFSIGNYQNAGNDYGRLIGKNRLLGTHQARVMNDEYDKDEAADFALWKASKDGEPSWKLKIGNKEVSGRPGWHIECSAMSSELGELPFEIHTGGIDLAFPHHENEIAQTYGATGSQLSKIFFHNNHLFIDGKKMSKSLNNFYTLEYFTQTGFDPLAFRLLVLSTHYRKEANFSQNTMVQAHFNLEKLQALADQRFQSISFDNTLHNDFNTVLGNATNDFKNALSDDLDTPAAIQAAIRLAKHVREVGLPKSSLDAFEDFLTNLDAALGLSLMDSEAVSVELMSLIADRDKIRSTGNFEEADKLRDRLYDEGIEIDDTFMGTRWYRRRTKF